MAINEEPLNFSSDSSSMNSDAETSDRKPEIPETNTSDRSLSESNSFDTQDRDLKESILVPLTPQKPTSLKPSTEKVDLVKTKRQKTPLWKRWQVWGILLVLCSGGVGYGATTILLKLPKTQSCAKVFWPIASASIRLYCAQTAAESKDVTGLLDAIDLVAVLPENHPLRPEIDRNIDRWATGILELAESEFQEGALDKAISTAEKIPSNLSAKEIVDSKIADWNSVWSEGEEQYAKVEEKLRESDWNGAFNWAVRLTDSPNQYWATTKYEESINNINVAQEEDANLTKAKTDLGSGSIEDLILAIDRADDIKKGSYTYDRAQDIVAEAKEKLVAQMELLVERRNWQELLRMTPRIPSSLDLKEKTRDWRILANAGASAQLDTVFGIEEAIEEAEKLEQDSEYYDLGQKLIKNWRAEIDGVRHLSRAREIARVGTIANLNKAIAEAKLVKSINPRYGEAQQEINKWRGQIQVIEDRPILNRAKELSYGNNVSAWRRAIAEVNLISPSSPLYSEAQSYTRTWRASIERVEDRPILNEADDFANINNYTAAIESARRIKPGRALYSDAQSRISRWQQEIDGKRYLAEAQNIASTRNSDDLAQAIRVARQVSPNSSVHSQVVSDVNNWAAEILYIARQASERSLEEAIAIAQKVPSGTTSYSTAQGEIKIWRIRLEPPEESQVIPPTFKLEKLRKEREEDN